MYHPSRGGVRGGRDQFKWDDVKVDKHRENYLGHSIKAPVGRWQKGKDLFWYSKDKNSGGFNQDALKAEIQKVKEEEEQLMREALGLAPKRASRPQGNRLDNHEFSELVKRSSTAEDLGAGHAEAAQVQGLGFSRAPRGVEESSSALPSGTEDTADTLKVAPAPARKTKEGSEDEETGRKKRRRHEERRLKEKRHDRLEKSERRRAHESDDGKKHKRKGKEKTRQDSD